MGRGAGSEVLSTPHHMERDTEGGDTVDLNQKVYVITKGIYSDYVRAKDEQRAMKIAQDEYAKWKAEKEGVV